MPSSTQPDGDLLAPRHWLWTWGPAVLCAAALFTLSSFSALPAPPMEVSDKAEHFTAYSLFTLSILWGLSGGRPSTVSWTKGLGALALASLYGVTDELHQYFVPGRTCDVHDWMADTSGAAIAVMLGLAAIVLVRRSRPD